MYKKEVNCWKSDPYEEAIIAWCQEPYNKDNPDAMFILADILLEKASKGEKTVDAVYLMEQAAKKGHARAAQAMGQLFQYGWAVSRSRKSALMWYEKAAELGNPEAAALISGLKAQKRRRTIGHLFLCCLLSVQLVFCFFICRRYNR